jgi:hypothetical protein
MKDGFFPFCPLKSRDCGWARDDLIECRVGRWYEEYRNSYVWIRVVVVRCMYTYRYTSQCKINSQEWCMDVIPKRNPNELKSRLGAVLISSPAIGSSP